MFFTLEKTLIHILGKIPIMTSIIILAAGSYMKFEIFKVVNVQGTKTDSWIWCRINRRSVTNFWKEALGPFSRKFKAGPSSNALEIRRVSHPRKNSLHSQ